MTPNNPYLTTATTTSCTASSTLADTTCSSMRLINIFDDKDCVTDVDLDNDCNNNYNSSGCTSSSSTSGSSSSNGSRNGSRFSSPITTPTTPTTPIPTTFTPTAFTPHAEEEDAILFAEIKKNNYNQYQHQHQYQHEHNISPSLPPITTTGNTNTNTTTNYGSDVDDLLSKELMKLSFQDRNHINEEMHGVRCLAPTETPDMLQKALDELQIQLDQTHYKPSYDKAQQQGQQAQAQQADNDYDDIYVNTDEFRLKFLRCEFFDVEAACIRMLNYLDLLVELYGDYALERPIQLSDFTKQEIQILRAGYSQLWPFRDRSGRRILSIVGNLAMEFDPTLRAKAYFYFWMIASDDIESQQKGVVFLVWPTLDNSVGSSNNNSASASGGRDRDSGGLRGGRSSNFTSTSSTISNKLKQAIPDQTDRRLHMKMNAAAPIRICAVHFCYPNRPFYHVLRSVMTMTLGIHYRHRLKFHVGEGIELQYILKSYGIPIENLPITDTGNIKTTYLKQWLRVRKIVEVEITPSGQSTKLLSIIECPRSVDVIFRPGTSMLCHPGNVTFRGLIESKQHRTAVKRSEKEKVALEIINDIQLLGGRFLNWNNIGYWMDITHNLPVCVDKIVVSYRDYKKKVRNATNAAMLMNNNSSSGNGNGSINNSNRRSAPLTTTTTMDCSTYAFLGQQDGKKRKRTATTSRECFLFST